MSEQPQNTNQDVQPVDEQRFTAEMDAVIREAEDMRLRYMQQQRGRNAVSMTLGLLSLVIGAGGFGWYLLMEADLMKAIASMVLALVLPMLLHVWSLGPIKAYMRDYKTQFMPKMARAMGGLQFYPERGIGAKILSKTGVLPSYDSYEAEDCFMGNYKGAKLIFSEARLRSRKNRKGPVFDGIFVLLEMKQEILEGHTIVTANKDMANHYGPTRWKKLQPVTIAPRSDIGDRFAVYSNKPDAAALLVGDSFLKELAEAADIFDESPLTAVLFRKKYVFLMIPHDQNMFEASNMHVPVTTREHAMICKKEIERILEIIDVLEIYQTNKAPQNSSPE